MTDELEEAHKPQFESAPGQARKAATVEDSLAAAAELKPMSGPSGGWPVNGEPPSARRAKWHCRRSNVDWPLPFSR